MSKKKRQPGEGPARRGQKGQAADAFPLDAGALPDPRVLEGLLRQHLRQGDALGEDNSALARAQDLVYRAFQADDWQARVELARQALEISPDCADAYVCLAELAPTAQDALAEWERGVAAGTRVLGGERALDRYAGHFWGMLETRPYMRARLGLAQCLWALRRREQAIGHCRALLRLNPNDNQGVRYV